MSPTVMSVRNPIREVTENLGAPNPEKEVVSLAVGDPSATGLMAAPEEATEAVVRAAQGGQRNGYTGSCGTDEARAAVARSCHLSSSSGNNNTNVVVEKEDVFVCQGCSQALQHSLAALAFPGSNILLPRVGFPLYNVLASYYGMEVRFYELKPHQEWQIDIASLYALSDENTAAILVCNPSNPCGAVYSSAHLSEVVAAAHDLKVPLLADEVYAGIAWGRPFVSLASLSQDVPVIEVGALSKRFVVPGWRLGWIIVHDRNEILADAGLYQALTKLQQITLSSNSLIQSALPDILDGCPTHYHEEMNEKLAKAAEICVQRVDNVDGLQVTSVPQGAMYLMVEIERKRLQGIEDDVQFARQLLKEESVVILPGRCFGAPNTFRVVFAAPERTLHEAWDRIENFCKRRRRS